MVQDPYLFSIKFVGTNVNTVVIFHAFIYSILMPISSGSGVRGKFNFLNIAAVAFLVVSLSAATYITASPQIKQIFSSQARCIDNAHCVAGMISAKNSAPHAVVQNPVSGATYNAAVDATTNQVIPNTYTDSTGKSYTLNSQTNALTTTPTGSYDQGTAINIDAAPNTIGYDCSKGGCPAGMSSTDVFGYNQINGKYYLTDGANNPTTYQSTSLAQTLYNVVDGQSTARLTPDETNYLTSLCQNSGASCGSESDLVAFSQSHLQTLDPTLYSQAQAQLTSEQNYNNAVLSQSCSGHFEGGVCIINSTTIQSDQPNARMNASLGLPATTTQNQALQTFQNSKVAVPSAVTDAQCGQGMTAEGDTCRNEKTGATISYSDILLYNTAAGVGNKDATTYTNNLCKASGGDCSNVQSFALGQLKNISDVQIGTQSLYNQALTAAKSQQVAIAAEQALQKAAAAAQAQSTQTVKVAPNGAVNILTPNGGTCDFSSRCESGNCGGGKCQAAPATAAVPTATVPVTPNATNNSSSPSLSQFATAVALSAASDLGIDLNQINQAINNVAATQEQIAQQNPTENPLQRMLNPQNIIQSIQVGETVTDQLNPMKFLMPGQGGQFVSNIEANLPVVGYKTAGTSAELVVNGFTTTNRSSQNDSVLVAGANLIGLTPAVEAFNRNFGYGMTPEEKQQYYSNNNLLNRLGDAATIGVTAVTFGDMAAGGLGTQGIVQAVKQPSLIPQAATKLLPDISTELSNSQIVNSAKTILSEYPASTVSIETPIGSSATTNGASAATQAINADTNTAGSLGNFVNSVTSNLSDQEFTQAAAARPPAIFSEVRSTTENAGETFSAINPRSELAQQSATPVITFEQNLAEAPGQQIRLTIGDQTFYPSTLGETEDRILQVTGKAAQIIPQADGTTAVQFISDLPAPAAEIPAAPEPEPIAAEPASAPNPQPPEPVAKPAAPEPATAPNTAPVQEPSSTANTAKPSLAEQIFGENKNITLNQNSSGVITLHPGDTITYRGETMNIPAPSDFADLGIDPYYQINGGAPQKFTVEGIQIDTSKLNYIDIGPLTSDAGTSVDQYIGPDTSKLYGDKFTGSPEILIGHESPNPTIITRANPEPGLAQKLFSGELFKPSETAELPAQEPVSSLPQNGATAPVQPPEPVPEAEGAGTGTGISGTVETTSANGGLVNEGVNPATGRVRYSVPAGTKPEPIADEPLFYSPGSFLDNLMQNGSPNDVVISSLGAATTLAAGTFSLTVSIVNDIRNFPQVKSEFAQLGTDVSNFFHSFKVNPPTAQNPIPTISITSTPTQTENATATQTPVAPTTQVPSISLQDNSSQYKFTVSDPQNILSSGASTIQSGSLVITTQSGQSINIVFPNTGIPYSVSDIKTFVQLIQNLGGLGKYFPNSITFVEEPDSKMSHPYIMDAPCTATGGPCNVSLTIDSSENSPADIATALAATLKYGGGNNYGQYWYNTLQWDYYYTFYAGRGGAPGDYSLYDPKTVFPDQTDTAGKSMTTASNDLANMISLYLTDPNALKSQDPARYAFIDAVYKGYDPETIQLVGTTGTFDPNTVDTTSLIQNNQDSEKAQLDYLNSITWDKIDWSNYSTNYSLDQFKNIIQTDSNESGVPVSIIVAVIERESSGDPNHITPMTGGGQAVGLMQIQGGSSDPSKNISQGVDLLKAIYNDPTLGNGNWRDSVALYYGGDWNTLLTGELNKKVLNPTPFGYVDDLLTKAGIDPNQLMTNSTPSNPDQSITPTSSISLSNATVIADSTPVSGQNVSSQVLANAQTIMSPTNCGVGSDGFYNSCNGTSGIYWCTYLVKDAAKAAGVIINGDDGANAMYEDFTNRKAVILSENANITSSQPLVKEGMVAFVMQQDQAGYVSHVGIVSNIQDVSPTDVRVTIVQADDATIQTTYELNNNGILIANEDGHENYIRAFGDISKYGQN